MPAVSYMTMWTLMRAGPAMLEQVLEDQGDGYTRWPGLNRVSIDYEFPGLDKVPYYVAANLFDWALMLKMVIVLPAVPLGVWFGRWLVRKVNQQTFEKIIIAALALVGTIILIEAFTG